MNLPTQTCINVCPIYHARDWLAQDCISEDGAPPYFWRHMLLQTLLHKVHPTSLAQGLLREYT